MKVVRYPIWVALLDCEGGLEIQDAGYERQKMQFWRSYVDGAVLIGDEFVRFGPFRQRHMICGFALIRGRGAGTSSDVVGLVDPEMLVRAGDYAEFRRGDLTVEEVFADMLRRESAACL